MNPVTENNHHDPAQPDHAQQGETQAGEPQQASNLPLRGMAMILIAVAVLLALWGAYAAYRPSTDSSSENAEAETQVVVTHTPTQEPAPEAETPQVEPVTVVHVLNNSTIQGLAANAAAKVNDLGWQAGETGNYAEDILSQNTVFFTPETPGAEEAAQRLAEQTGAVVAPKPDNLPDPTGDPQTLVLVLVQDF